MREGWPVEEHYRGPLVKRQVAIAIDPSVSPGEATKAFNAVLSASRQNLEIVKTIAGIEKPDAPAVNVNVGIQIVKRDDFYANDAHNRDAESSGTSANGAAIAGTVQDADLRPKVGQNGNGTHGSNGRTRPHAGDAEGSH
jgi:hypothetical protein